MWLTYLLLAILFAILSGTSAALGYLFGFDGSTGFSLVFFGVSACYVLLSTDEFVNKKVD